MERQGPSKAWNVLLVNISSAESNLPSERTSEGRLFSIAAETDVVEIKALPE
jgi:hypothetical protein